MDKQAVDSAKEGLLAQIEVCKNGLRLSEKSEDALEFCRDIITAATKFVILVATDKD